ncbi:phage tail terminator family protein [Streptobacillus canis]|uniref:phage tail terminator family protein n=1 Tax=Streptobacillus canis TaxID=2678686 RepID=UPI0012E2323B|nr:hypothetical protein [Streptobacillus canis]
MIVELIKNINDRLNKYIPGIEIVSQDIDKNGVYPCFKVDLISRNLNRITENILEYTYSIVINFYPKPNVDNRILLLEIGEKLDQIFSFEFNGWQILSKEVYDNEDFITCALDYRSTRIYDNETELRENEDSLINEKEYETIEKIENKEEY